MGFYTKKPVTVEAIQYDGGNHEEIINFCKGAAECVYGHSAGPNEEEIEYKRLTIETLEGSMLAWEGDWIIKGVEGEFYPCKPAIFEATYDPAA